MQDLTVTAILQFYTIGLLFGFFTGAVIMLIGIVINFFIKFLKKG